MKLLANPVRIEFCANERNAAQRALMYLVTDFGLKICHEQISKEVAAKTDRREWLLPIGEFQAHFAVESGSDRDLNSPLSAAGSTTFIALNLAGAQLLELLHSSLRRIWSDPKKGPTYLRPTINRQQAQAIMDVLR